MFEFIYLDKILNEQNSFEINNVSINYESDYIFIVIIYVFGCC